MSENDSLVAMAREMPRRRSRSNRAAEHRAEGAAAERQATVAHLRQRAADMARSKRLTAAERLTLRRRLDAMADEIAQGFHVEDAACS